MIFDAVISQILNGRLDLITVDYIPYFEGFHKHIYHVFWQLKAVSEPMTVDRIKTQIELMGWKPEIRNTVMHMIDELKEKRMICPDDVRGAMVKEYSSRIHRELYQKLSDKHLTPETLKKTVSEYAEKLSKTGGTHDLASYETLKREHIESIGSGEKSRLEMRTIKIKCPILSKIFGEEILPQPQLILGRPNDGKTSLALCLQHEFYKLGYKGLHVTLEDSKQIYMTKMLAIESGKEKKDVMFGRVKKSEMMPYYVDNKNGILILDRSRNSDELVSDIQSVIDLYDIRWVMVDFIQEVSPKRYEKEMDTISAAMRGLKNISIKNEIACFAISQAPKSDVAHKAAKLGTGNEYGAAALGNLSRQSWSVNPDPDGGLDKRLVSRYKTSYLPHGDFIARFDFTTGQIKSVEEYNG